MAETSRDFCFVEKKDFGENDGCLQQLSEGLLCGNVKYSLLFQRASL